LKPVIKLWCTCKVRRSWNSYIWNLVLICVLKFIHLLERTELVSGETSVAVRGIQRGRMM
jgi:hypothetical protein